MIKIGRMAGAVRQLQLMKLAQGQVLPLAGFGGKSLYSGAITSPGAKDMQSRRFSNVPLTKVAALCHLILINRIG